MDQPLHTYVRPGIVLCVAFPEAERSGDALVRAIEAIAADDYFSVVEVRYAPDDTARRRLIDVLRASHLGVIYEAHPRLHAQALDLNSSDDALRSRAIEVCKQAIDEAIDIGAERINLVSGPDPGADRRERGADALVDSLYALCEYAAERGAPILALEPYPRGVNGHLIGPSAEAIALVRLVREVYPTFSLTLDTSTIALLGEDMGPVFAAAMPYLGQVHLANVAVAGGNNALPFGAPGGVYDTPQVAEALLALFRAGFLGANRQPPILFRVAPRDFEHAAWVIAGAKRTLSAAWARL